MPNSEIPHDDDRDHGLDAISARDEHSTETGSQADLAPMANVAAGDSVSAPRQFTADEVVNLLVRAIHDLTAAGKVPIAAGVGARMRLLEPQYTAATTEFGTFRAIVAAGEARGLVVVESGENDLVVRAVADEPSPAQYRITLRPDLWRALLDWEPTARYLFNRVTKQSRPSLAVASGDDVLIASITREIQIEWMRRFADTQVTPSVRSELIAALDSEHPTHAFSTALGSSDTIRRRWKRHLRQCAIDHAIAWGRSNKIELSDLVAPVEPRPAISPTPASRESVADETSHPGLSEDELLRQRLLTTIATLPLSELLQLRIPLQYTLR
jgi:hypothetical protein